MRQLTLMDFPDDDNSRPPMPAAARAGSDSPVRVTYSRLPIGHRRTLCDDCVALIHELGVIAAPLPASARQRRISGKEQVNLCNPHTDARRLHERRQRR